MANIALHDFLKFRIYCHMGSQASVNTHYYQVGPNAPNGNWSPALLLSTWATAIAPGLKPLLANVAFFDGSSIQVVTIKPYSALLYSNQSAGAGTAVGNPLPTQVCGMISRRTDYSGRAYRGRLYMPFPTTTFADTNGLPTTAYQNALSTYVLDAENTNGLVLTAAPNNITLMPILWHKIGTAAPAPITGHEYPVKFGTQRRRGSYGKANFSPPMMVPQSSGVINYNERGLAGPGGPRSYPAART